MVQQYKTMTDIRDVLPRLKRATVPGKTCDGRMIQVRYESFGTREEESKRDIAAAEKLGLDPRIFTGFIDTVKKTAGPNPHTLLTMRVLERINPETNTYGFRTFNLNKGRIRWLKVL